MNADLPCQSKGVVICLIQNLAEGGHKMKEMKKFQKMLATALAIVLSVAVFWDSVAAAGYATYVNGRFGYRIKYPRFFKQSGPLPQNGDGITMSGKGAKLLVWGGYNAVYENGKEMKRFYKVDCGIKMSAVRANKKSLYFESRKGKKITFHYSYFVGGGHINMELTCRKGKKKYFGKIVNKMKKSMRVNKRIY